MKAAHWGNLQDREVRVHQKEKIEMYAAIWVRKVKVGKREKERKENLSCVRYLVCVFSACLIMLTNVSDFL